MPGELYDFGDVSEFHAEAIGEPGQRRFRLTAQNDEASASLWLEKEQAAALGAALEQQLVRAGAPRQTDAGAEREPGSFPLNPSVDFQVGQLALGYDEERDVFLIQVYSTEANEEGQPTFGCSITRRQARRLINEIGRLMVSGRPTCPLCGAPMQGQHICPRSNGHAKVSLS